MSVCQFILSSFLPAWWSLVCGRACHLHTLHPIRQIALYNNAAICVTNSLLPLFSPAPRSDIRRLLTFFANCSSVNSSSLWTIDLSGINYQSSLGWCVLCSCIGPRMYIVIWQSTNIHRPAVEHKRPCRQNVVAFRWNAQGHFICLSVLNEKEIKTNFKDSTPLETNRWKHLHV